MNDPCRPRPTSPPKPKDDVTWTKSSFCAHGDCLEALRAGRVVLVRNSTNPGHVQAWSQREWELLLAAVRSGEPHEGVQEIGVLGRVLLGLHRHLDDGGLVFTGGDWWAFRRGVKAGEFDFDNLPLWADQTSLPTEEPAGSGAVFLRGGAAPIEATEAGSDGAVLPASVAAQGSSATADVEDGPLVCPPVRPADSAGDASPRAGGGDRPATVPVAGPNVGAMYVPAGRPTSRVSSPPGSSRAVATSGRPGPTVLERACEIVLSHLGWPVAEAEAVVADLHDAGLLVDEPLVDADELLRRGAEPLVPAPPPVVPFDCYCYACVDARGTS